MGCYMGETSVELGRLLKRGDDGDARELWLYDSFEGLPEKRREDLSAAGEEFCAGELVATKAGVSARFKKAGLRAPRIRKAWFCDLGEEDMPKAIAFGFLDGDYYESIRDSLRLVGPRMEAGGIIAIHDYGNPRLPGVARATEEYITARIGGGFARNEAGVGILRF
jgi:O-methyltransferase